MPAGTPLSFPPVSPITKVGDKVSGNPGSCFVVLLFVWTLHEGRLGFPITNVGNDGGGLKTPGMTGGAGGRTASHAAFRHSGFPLKTAGMTGGMVLIKQKAAPTGDRPRHHLWPHPHPLPKWERESLAGPAAVPRVRRGLRHPGLHPFADGCMKGSGRMRCGPTGGCGAFRRILDERGE